MAPITRFAAFKFKDGVTDEQKRQALGGLMKLYKEYNEDKVLDGPRAGSNSTSALDSYECVLFVLLRIIDRQSRRQDQRL